MGQSELGKQEEMNAAELSPNETDAATPDPSESAPVEAVEEAVAKVEAADEIPAPSSDSSVEEAATDSHADEDEVVAAAVEVHEDEVAAADDVMGADEEEDYPDASDSLDHDDDETVEEEAADTPASGARKLRRGDVLEATVLRATPTSIFFDVGLEAEGVVPGREMELMTRKMLDELHPGMKMMVYVVNPRDHQGNVLLSINRAIEESDWRRAEEYEKSKEVYDGKIAGYNKGGLIVRFGRLRGFLPHSQVADDRRARMAGETPEERYDPMVNEAIGVKVMEVDRSRNRLILSERAAMREVRQRRKENLIGELGVGELREGVVVSLEDFGAFVDIGGAEGLIHLTELSWKHVTHPRQFLSIGQRVEVRVISVDHDRNRIGLSMKQLEADPWDAIATAYQVGQLVQGSVTKLTKFGAFAQLVDAPEVEGLIHISELSDQRVSHPKEIVQRGDKLTLRVVKIDVKNRRLGLSLKRVNSAEFLDYDLGAAPGEQQE